MSTEVYREVRGDGIQAVIIHERRLLLLKRVNLPFFVSNPGIWSFVAGGREKDETYLQAAYREIKEETKLVREDLVLLRKDIDVKIADPSKLKKWDNKMFIFKSATEKVRLNYEHRAYKWATYTELLKHSDTLKTIYNKDAILPIIKRYSLKS